jgi:predicted amidophosphoribosyltransferase
MYAIYDFGHPLVARAIHDLKYYRKSEAVQILIEHGAPLINEWLADLLQSPQPHQMVLVPIPLHPARLKERGFNQSALLARRIAKTIPNTKTIPLLKKYRLTIPQARIKHRPERIINLSHSMKTVRTINSTLLYILVDDVMTTGATFQEATRALKEAGAQRILSLALAHGYSRKK